MKQCTQCYNQWNDCKQFCPYDGQKLFSVENSNLSSSVVSTNNSLPISDDTPTITSLQPFAVWFPDTSAQSGQEFEEIHSEFLCQVESLNEDNSSTISELNSSGEFTDDRFAEKINIFEIAQRARDVTHSSPKVLATPIQLQQAPLEYFQLFNERKRSVQQFVELLSQKGFSYTKNYDTQTDYIVCQFAIFFEGEENSKNFTLSIVLYRQPNYSVAVSIDLMDIGNTPEECSLRTQLLGGTQSNTKNGPIYHLDLKDNLSNELFLEWLEKYFKKIFSIVYDR